MITVEGELDMSTATDLERELEGPLAAAGAPLLIDLGRCEFIDSTGIALIVRSWQTLDGDGSERFALCGIGQQVKRVLDRLKRQSGSPVSPQALFGYEAMRLVLESIRRAGRRSDDRDAVASAAVIVAMSKSTREQALERLRS